MLKRMAIPREKLPARFGDMELTPELLADYSGHETLLRFRALHSPQCYPAVDNLRLCIVHKEKREDECAKFAMAYKPCAADVAKRRALLRKEREEDRRRALAASVREKESSSASSSSATN